MRRPEQSCWKNARMLMEWMVSDGAHCSDNNFHYDMLKQTAAGKESRGWGKRAHLKDGHLAISEKREKKRALSPFSAYAFFGQFNPESTAQFRRGAFFSLFLPSSSFKWPLRRRNTNDPFCRVKRERESTNSSSSHHHHHHHHNHRQSILPNKKCSDRLDYLIFKEHISSRTGTLYSV